MKILFVLKHVYYIDPMGVMLLSALAKMKGHTTYLHILDEADILGSLKRIKPDVVAFSARTGEHKYYLDASQTVKRYSKNIFTIMGGPHTTFFPETLGRSSLDAICVGEGDEAWPEFLDTFERGGDIHVIPNIYTRQNMSRPPPIRVRKTDLDSLPFLDRELVYQNSVLGRFPLRSHMAGRGCPFRCTYCFNHAYNQLYLNRGKLYNRYSVDRLVAELSELKARYPTQFIKFYDDVFVFKDDQWLEEFAQKYPSKIGLPFHCLIRADLLTEPMLRKLKQAGLHSISMSIETGNDVVRERLLRRRMPRESIIKAFELCQRYGVHTFANTILAIPDTTLREDLESLDLNLRCKVTLGLFPIFFPYPKTELGEYSIRQGYFDGDYNRLHMYYEDWSPLSCFTHKQKLMQKNLSLLGTIVIWMPRIRRYIKPLIKLPLGRLYTIIYYLVKAYIVKTKIYPLRFSLPEMIRWGIRSLRLELFVRGEEI